MAWSLITGAWNYEVKCFREKTRKTLVRKRSFCSPGSSTRKRLRHCEWGVVINIKRLATGRWVKEGSTNHPLTRDVLPPLGDKTPGPPWGVRGAGRVGRGGRWVRYAVPASVLYTGAARLTQVKAIFIGPWKRGMPAYRP